jgi:hypothetical protein
MADINVTITVGAGDTSTETLLTIANKISQTLIGQDASASLKPSKTDIISKINKAYKDLLKISKNWKFMRYSDSVATPTNDIVFPSYVKKIIYISNPVNGYKLKEWSSDLWENDMSTQPIPQGFFVVTGYTYDGQMMVTCNWGTIGIPNPTATYLADLKAETLVNDTDTSRIPDEYRNLLYEMALFELIVIEGFGNQDRDNIMTLDKIIKEQIKLMQKDYLPPMDMKEFSPRGVRNPYILRRSGRE